MMNEEMVFVDPDGSVHDVHGDVSDVKSVDQMVEMDYYTIDKYLYVFVGESTKLSAPEGSLFVEDGLLFVQQYEDEEAKEAHHVNHTRSKSEYKNMVSWKQNSIDDIADNYTMMTNNAMDSYNILANTGSVYIPELKDDDDPMERVMKLMIISMELKLNEKRGTTDKEYAIDNLRSALNGATKNMSILKFLMWCNVLHLDWEFSLINDPSASKQMLDNPVTISNKKPLDIEIPSANPDGKIFWVPLVEGEDPLKRLMKVALWVLQVNLKEYRNKGTSSHCINNLRSGLKGKQKMSIQGMLKWCEILDLMLVVKVTNPETGTWYKSVGYTVSTNVPDDEHTKYVEEK